MVEWSPFFRFSSLLLPFCDNDSIYARTATRVTTITPSLPYHLHLNHHTNKNIKVNFNQPLYSNNKKGERKQHQQQNKAQQLNNKEFNISYHQYLAYNHNHINKKRI